MSRKSVSKIKKKKALAKKANKLPESVRYVYSKDSNQENALNYYIEFCEEKEDAIEAAKNAVENGSYNALYIYKVVTTCIAKAYLPSNTVKIERLDD